VRKEGMLKKKVETDEELLCWTSYQCTTKYSVF